MFEMHPDFLWWEIPHEISKKLLVILRITVFLIILARQTVNPVFHVLTGSIRVVPLYIHKIKVKSGLLCH